MLLQFIPQRGKTQPNGRSSRWTQGMCELSGISTQSKHKRSRRCHLHFFPFVSNNLKFLQVSQLDRLKKKQRKTLAW